ncbi:MAG: pyridoxal-phosphate dependent enzyme [Propionibacteriales bacterium]|nr:pyridoxal-phosphate dependent enzyme [Propionibacteriales bacterium]
MSAVDPVRRPDAADLDAALRVVGAQLSPTPVVPASPAGRTMLKLETFQPTGSFKVRGALAAMSALEPGERAITASAGNHGLGIAYAAKVLDRQATVVVPETGSRAKLAALGEWPVTLVRHGADFDAAERHALRLAKDGGRYVSAYNDARVIAGQATIVREVTEQVPGPVTLVCGVGGGGLCAGLSLVASGTDDVEVVGVEAEGSRAVSAAIAAGRVVPVAVGDTLADGLAGNLDDPCVTPEIIGRHAAGLVAVSEQEIRSAIRWLFSRHGLVAEGAAAAGVGALLSGKVSVPADRTVVVVLSGRNISASAFRDVLRDP